VEFIYVAIKTPQSRWIPFGSAKIIFKTDDDKIHTNEVWPCIAIASFSPLRDQEVSGTLSHLNPANEKAVENFRSFLYSAELPKDNTSFALIGGIDAESGYTAPTSFHNSQGLVSAIKMTLHDAGFAPPDFEELYGQHRRTVTLRGSGLITVTDTMDKEYSVCGSLNPQKSPENLLYQSNHQQLDSDYRGR